MEREIRGRTWREEKECREINTENGQGKGWLEEGTGGGGVAREE